MKKICGLLAAVTLLCSFATATTLRRLDFNQLLDHSELVVYGKVVSTYSYIMPERGWVLTDTRIQVMDAAKGQAGPFVTVTELGGVVGDKGMIVPGTARFQVGEEAVLFLKNLAGKWRTTGLIQGKFPVIQERGERFAIPAVPMAAAADKIPLAELLQRIRQADRDSRRVVR
ncbi:MAG TPA: hypothetical protein VGL91_21740 [Acidobacteriota bacterium]|jgi:hypothetical protein